MEVISKKSNRKLIKGNKYDAIWATDTKIFIKKFGQYKCMDFTNVDGSKIDPFGTPYTGTTSYQDILAKDIKKGDIITCQRDNQYSFLVKGCKYRVSDVKLNDPKDTWQSPAWRCSVKFEGYNRWISWSPYAFKKIPLDELREIKLGEIFDKPENFSIDFRRKFEKVKNQDSILLESLSRSILDRFRHDYDVIDWAVEKTSRKYGLKREDFDEMMNMPLKDILKKYENCK